MKSWITYLISVLLGLASAVVFGTMPEFKTTVFTITKILVNIGGLVLIPVILFSFTAGVASLRKDRLGGKASTSTAIWTVMTSILLPLGAGLVFFIIPAVFPIRNQGDTLTYLTANALSHFSGQMQYSGLVTLSMFLPMILVSWLFGWLMKPSSDTIRPAYAVMNSFSEVMYRLTHVYTWFGYVITYFASCVFFTTQILSDGLGNAPEFMCLLFGGTFFLIFVMLPLIFAILTLFKENPYRVMVSALPGAMMAFLTGNLITASPTLLTSSRMNDGVQKRITSTTMPFMMIFSKGGTAAIATICTLSLMGLHEVEITTESLILVAIFSGCASLISFSGTGFETAMVVSLVTKFMGIDLGGGENALLILIPVINGCGVAIDSYIMALGAKYNSIMTETDARIPYGDWI